jgi:hypothetical protein
MAQRRKATQRLDFSDFTETQKAYIAGFLDGDGSIIAQFVKKTDYKFGFQIRISALFIQKTSRTHFLESLSKEIGLGVVRQRGDGIAEYHIVGIKVLEPFLKAISPYLRIKKKQVNLVLKIIEQLPSTKGHKEKFVETCLLVDQVANLNDSNNRSITAEIVKVHLETLALNDISLSKLINESEVESESDD